MDTLFSDLYNFPGKAVEIIDFMRAAARGKMLSLVSISLKDLERSLHMSQSAISRMAVRLAKTEYVEIKPDESDQRVKLVCLTDKGRQCGVYMVDLMAEAEEQLLRGLTHGERLLLRELLEKMRENSVRCCLQKNGAEKPQKKAERKNENE